MALVDIVDETWEAHPEDDIIQMKDHGFVAATRDIDETGGLALRAHNLCKEFD